MSLIFDYKEKVKELITESYAPAYFVSSEFKYTTMEITALLQNILPDKSIDDFMVFEALTELGFKPKEEQPLHFSWYFKRIND